MAADYSTATRVREKTHSFQPCWISTISCATADSTRGWDTHQQCWRTARYTRPAKGQSACSSGNGRRCNLSRCQRAPAPPPRVSYHDIVPRVARSTWKCRVKTACCRGHQVQIATRRQHLACHELLVVACADPVKAAIIMQTLT